MAMKLKTAKSRALTVTGGARLVLPDSEWARAGLDLEFEPVLEAPLDDPRFSASSWLLSQAFSRRRESS